MFPFEDRNGGGVDLECFEVGQRGKTGHDRRKCSTGEGGAVDLAHACEKPARNYAELEERMSELPRLNNLRKKTSAV
jgi:hypothetical protein